MSGRAEAEPFCFVKYKDKSAEDQVLGQPHCFFGRCVPAEISKTQHRERTLRHKEVKAKIKEDLRSRAIMGNKCSVGCFINDPLQKKKMQYQYAPLTGVYKPDMKEFFS